MDNVPLVRVSHWSYCRHDTRRLGANVEVNVLNLVAYLNRTPIFEWYVVWCGSNNKFKKDTCLQEIGLRAQNLITILGSFVNMIVRTRMTP